MAEGLFRRAVADIKPPISVSSAGIGAFDGDPPSDHSTSVMKDEGVDISAQRSAMMTDALMEEATHIFGMTRGHCEALAAYFPEHQEKIFVLREFLVGSDGLDLDVSDPIGGSRDEYIMTRNLILEAMPSVVDFVRGQDEDT